MWLPRPSFFQFSALSLALLLFAACGEGGKARFKFEPITDDKAIELLTEKDSNEGRMMVIDRIRTNRSADFNFADFWHEIQAAGLDTSLEPHQLEALFDLHDIDCEAEAFTEFARLVLESGYSDRFMRGVYRRCKTALPPDLLARYTEHFQELRQQRAEQQAVERYESMGRSLPNDEFLRDQIIAEEVQREREEARFLAEEILRNPDGHWEPVLCRMLPYQFFGMMQVFRDKEEEDVLRSLMRTYKGCEANNYLGP